MPAGTPATDAVRIVASACGVIVRSTESLAFTYGPGIGDESRMVEQSFVRWHT